VRELAPLLGVSERQFADSRLFVEMSESFAFLSNDFILISRFEASPLFWQISWYTS